MRYDSVDRDIKKIEDATPKPKPRPPEHPLVHKLEALGTANARFALEIALGLAEAGPPCWNENGNSILVHKQNCVGVRKQAVFDWLEQRNGVVDVKTRNLLIEIPQEKGKTTLEAEKLLHALHLKLMREVMDVSRPYLKLITANPESILHCEFELDTRFPSLFTNVGPAETRCAEMGPYLSQQQLNRRLKEIYAKNCVRWRKILEAEQ